MLLHVTHVTAAIKETHLFYACIFHVCVCVFITRMDLKIWCGTDRRKHLLSQFGPSFASFTIWAGGVSIDSSVPNLPFFHSIFRLMNL